MLVLLQRLRLLRRLRRFLRWVRRRLRRLRQRVLLRRLSSSKAAPNAVSIRFFLQRFPSMR
jgi:hypothetical protein